jgi:hypothetical protein
VAFSTRRSLAKTVGLSITPPRGGFFFTRAGFVTANGEGSREKRLESTKARTK